MYLSLDVETGGFGLDKSLLELSLILLDNDFNPQGEFTVKLKPDDGIYVVEARALEINKINLVEHDKMALPYKKVKTQLYEFLHEAANCNKLTLIGKNVYGDVLQVWDKLISRSSWEQFVSYQWLDLSSVWIFLVAAGKVDRLSSSSLKDIAPYLGVPFIEQHTAYCDAKVTADCMKILINRVEQLVPY